jgi:CheY-like chemotaxis protein
MDNFAKGRPGIIIADDDPVILSLYSKILRNRYQIIAESSNGADLVRYFEANMGFLFRNYSSILVLLDYQMPQMDGIEAAKRLRRTKRSNALKIALATASRVSAGPLNEEKSGRLFDLVLKKPFSGRVLLEAIESLTLADELTH